MPFYVTTPYGGTRAKLCFKKPDPPFVTVDSIPTGEGEYHLIDGELKLLPSSQTDLLVELKKADEEKTLLKAQVEAQTNRIEFLEDCLAELAIQSYR